MMSISASVRDLKKIERGFADTLRKLRKELEKLEGEKASLFEEIEDLKARGKARASKLREEVETLREEVEVFRGLISAAES